MTVDHGVPAIVGQSTDGRIFSFSGVQADFLAVGDVLALPLDDDATVLVQVRDLFDPDLGSGGTRATGVPLGVLTADGEFGPAPVGAVTAAAIPATTAQVEAIQIAAGAQLPIGKWKSADVEAAALLRAHGFNRHTFLCGQSGSGKTYALGVILEQLLLATELRMVIFDPNADFVGLAQTRPGAPAEAVARLAEATIRVLGSNATGATPLRARYMTMSTQAQAAILRLDPIVDRAEYNHFLQLRENLAGRVADVTQVVAELRTGDADAVGLAQRIQNLGLPWWEVWAADLQSAAEVIDEQPRATVLNLSGFADPVEPLVAAFDVVERLWAARESRTPTLLVIDEAHNLCPAEPTSALQRALVERLIQIAAEGRKYGLWLLLSTQRPSKIHPQVLSQCDNLVLMRMNSAADVAELCEVFGYAPPAMMRTSPFFAQGEALVAGRFVATPTLIRMGERLTPEGGGDVVVPLPVPS